MPRNHSGARTPTPTKHHTPQAPIDQPKSITPLLRARHGASSSSLGGAEDEYDESDTTSHIVTSDAPHHLAGSVSQCFPSAPAPPPPRGAADSAPTLPVVAQRRRCSALPSPNSALAASPSAGTPPQRPPSQHQPHRVDGGIAVSSPLQRTESVPHGRASPAVRLPTPTERRTEASGQRGPKGQRPPSPATPNASFPARHLSPAAGVSPPPVHFSVSPATSPAAQHASPVSQALISPAPQLALQRTASRTRPIIAGSSAGSLCGTPQPGTIQLTEAALPPRPPTPLAGSPSTQRALVLEPTSPVRSPSQDSADDAVNPAPLIPAAAERPFTRAATRASHVIDDDQRDLLVERIIQNPNKMGQNNAGCSGRSHPPRESSNSRSSPLERGAAATASSPSTQPNTTPRGNRPASPQRRKGSNRPDSRRGAGTPTGTSGERAVAATAESTAAAAAAAVEVDDAQWVFQRPPNNQRTFYFKEDNLELSSQFDSGNLIQVERVGAFQYRMYTAMDCGNAPWQTNNRQWFHFSLRGGAKGVLVTFTFVGMMHSSMFNFDWMPVSAVTPTRPEYARVAGKAKVEALELMPETPGYPLLVHKSLSKDDADSDDEENEGDNNGAGAGTSTAGGGVAFSISAGGKGAAASGGKKKKAKKKKNIAMNLTFEYKIEAEVPVTHTPPRAVPSIPAIYIASNHPYSYNRLQRNLVAWQEAARRGNATRSQSVQGPLKTAAAPAPDGGEEAGETRAAQTPTTPHLSGSGRSADADGAESSVTSIYFHREVLCKSLEGHDVTLLTISDRSRMTMQRAPLISEADGIPHSSAVRTTERPFAFSGKKYVVLTARVHPGECPASHLMHGCIEFLLSRTDPRAAALRHHFVFYIVPMLNPDGVVRGHSRVDANGVDLNRMYRSPSRKRHPAPFSVMALLKSLRDEVALFVDMHAHANKRGTFFYGNSMDGAEQVENLLYARLVSLNTPYLDFRSCNFSEANMFAVGKSGKGKDSSSRVVVYTEAGVVHGYTIEASHVMAEGINPVVPLVSARGEEVEKALPAPLQLAHTPATFADTGRAMLVALLDLHGLNPLSRLPYTPYHSTRGVAMWLQRQLQIETAELLFAQAFKAHGKEVQAASHETGNGLLAPVLRSLTADEFPEKITIKKARLLPRTTYSGVRQFLSNETAAALLAQTAPSGPPRSLLYTGSVTGNGRSNSGGGGGSGAGANGRRGVVSPLRRTASNAATVGLPPPPSLPAVIATKRRPRVNGVETEAVAEAR